MLRFIMQSIYLACVGFHSFYKKSMNANKITSLFVLFSTERKLPTFFFLTYKSLLLNTHCYSREVSAVIIKYPVNKHQYSFIGQNISHWSCVYKYIIRTRCMIDSETTTDKSQRTIHVTVWPSTTNKLQSKL